MVQHMDLMTYSTKSGSFQSRISLFPWTEKNVGGGMRWGLWVGDFAPKKQQAPTRV